MVRTKGLIHMSWIVLREITCVFATNVVKKREREIDSLRCRDMTAISESIQRLVEFQHLNFVLQFYNT